MIKKLIYFIPVILLLIFIVITYAAKTSSVNITEIIHSGTTMKKITFTWTSDSFGNVDTLNVTTNDYSGIIWRVIFKNHISDTLLDSSYIAKIYDDDSVDVLNHLGIAISQEDSVTQFTPVTSNKIEAALTLTKLKLNIASAGSCKVGSVMVYIRYGDVNDL